jgi:hypothetical protein
MMRVLIGGFLFALGGVLVSAQTATLHIEVRSDAGPVMGAEVVVNGTTYKTDAQGVTTMTLPPGPVAIVVVKEGFASSSLSSSS